MVDPNFRGIVLGSSWRRVYGMVQPDGKGGLKRVPHREVYISQPWAINPLIRRSMLYFDKVALPTNNILPLEVSPGLEFLADEGELERENIDLHDALPHQLEMIRNSSRAGMGMHGSVYIAAQQIAKFHRSVFMRREAAEPGAWNFATVGEGLEFESEQTVRGYSMDLYNCLPAPSDSISYKDIVAFKKREKSALLALRRALGDMYISVDSCDDKPFAARNEIGKLEEAITVVQGLLTKSRIEYYLRSVSIDLTGDKTIKADKAIKTGLAVGAGLLGQHLNLSGVASVAAGVATAALLMVKIKDIQTPAARAGAFKYIYKAGSAGIVDPSGPDDNSE